MAPSLWISAYAIDVVALLIGAGLEALGWDLGIPAHNEDLVWH